MEPDENEVTIRALAPAPVDKRRRRWRRHVVLLDTVLIVAAMVVGLALALADNDDGALIAMATPVGLQLLLGAVLSSEYVLTDWLTPEDEREGRAYYLLPHYSLGACDRWPWGVWWTVNLSLWLMGGLLLGGAPGGLAGLGLGILATACCLLLGLIVGWMLIVPLGLVVGVLLHRRRTVQSARLLMFAVILLGMVVLAAPAAWTNLGAHGAGPYMRAVLGLPDHPMLAPGILWTARIGLAIVVLAVPPIIALLRSMPEQRVAGAIMPARFDPSD